jgi:hypothetical protein
MASLSPSFISEELKGAYKRTDFLPTLYLKFVESEQSVSMSPSPPNK